MSTITMRYAHSATWEGAPTEGDRPVSLDQMAALLGVDDNTPYTWSHRGVLPPHAGMVGRSRFWWESDIKQWHQERKTSGGRPRSAAAA